ncbi:unnamed protein product [Macrosiphum euphorbiae]|uniref:Uncharacterized protein n=1 Tax=Macrosiphum euphorbiae TaxID=13131 RepID=A0AAV0WCP9_9HEMI|nr:unnamed protein product [Macrosiphum euphorbiae]
MYDYLDSGHMNRFKTSETDATSSTYYISHHAVIKPGSTTTRVRVVYDASAISTNGKSLNDQLYPGPKLQQDLPGIIIRFRLHKVVFTTDIKQMFRQIVVTSDHRSYQRLLFWFKPLIQCKLLRSQLSLLANVHQSFFFKDITPTGN